MKSKLVFYGLLTGILGATAYLGMMLFMPADSDISRSPTVSKRKATQQKQKTTSTQKSATRLPSPDEMRGSIWTDESNFDKNLDVGSLKTSAEVEQAKNLLQELYKLSDKEAFLQKAKELADQYPSAAEFPAALAGHYYSKGDLIQAEVYLKETLSRSPNYVFARNTLADLYVKKGDFKKAEDTYTQVFEDGNDNLYAYQGYLGVAAMNGRAEEAKERLFSMYRANPSKTNLALSIADIYFTEDKLGERKQVLDKAYERDPFHPILNQVLAQDAMTQGNAEDALRYGQRAVDNDIDRNRQISMLNTMLEAAQQLQDREQIASIERQLSEIRGNL